MKELRGKLQDYDLRVVRLLKANENSEILIFDADKKKIYQYSYKRGLDVLKQLLENKLGLPISTILVNIGILNPDYKSGIVDQVYNLWIREEMDLFDNLNYCPYKPREYEFEQSKYFNMYNKSEILLEYEKLSQNGTINRLSEENTFDNIRTILMNLCENNEEYYSYFNNWLSYQLLNPDEKLATTIVFQGEQGTGKTLFTTYVLKPIFGDNYAEINQNDINKEFNDFIMGKQMIVANEVIYSNSRPATSERLKSFVTDRVVSINRKFKDSLNITNFSHWIFTSNNQVPIKIERKDRRFTVFKSEKLKNTFENYLCLSNPEILHKELLCYLHHLFSLKPIFSEVNTPLMTNAKKDILEASIDSIELFLDLCMESGGFDSFEQELNKEAGFNTLSHLTNNFITSKNTTYIKLSYIYGLYVEFCRQSGVKNKFGRNSFTTKLKHLNYKCTIIKDTDNKSHRVIDMRGVKE